MELDCDQNYYPSDFRNARVPQQLAQVCGHRPSGAGSPVRTRGCADDCTETWSAESDHGVVLPFGKVYEDSFNEVRLNVVFTDTSGAPEALAKRIR